ncbi:ubiquitin-related modifier 1 isoform X2 [Canis lupus dingo]|uniref:ubiquitin-related modifier 1 isoform X2 n=1 Tax=Canis lupus dingo TaxID=286419 RepID=UPI0003AE20B1|nr:ubiquitin-related modifier 1 isoform X2 [Canis lupus dingo]
MAAPLSVEVEFGGGAELLFDGVKKHQVTLPGQEEPWDIRSLLVWIKKNLLKERPELFIQGDSVRPGILVLVNDADWELLRPGPLFPTRQLRRNH